jgi:hypothetical protein
MKRILFSICFFALFFSCNSDDDSNVAPITEANFYALTVGNSWVYKYYRYNPNPQIEIFEATEVVDSVSIVSTEEIDGETYFKFRMFTSGNIGLSYYPENGEHFKYYREDSENLIDENDAIIFIKEDNEERLIYDSGWDSDYVRFLEDTFNTTTEAGSFETFAMEIYGKDNDGNRFPGTSHNYYADGIGSIINTISFASNPQHFLERRLESYSIN